MEGELSNSVENQTELVEKQQSDASMKTKVLVKSDAIHCFIVFLDRSVVGFEERENQTVLRIPFFHKTTTE